MNEGPVHDVTAGPVILTVLWPEREDTPLAEKLKDSPRKTNGDQGKLNEFPPSPATPPATADERS